MPKFSKQDILWAHKARNDLFLFNESPDFAECELSELVKLLQIADDAYYNTATPIFHDDEYDAMRRYVESADPTNEYFDNVGSDVRGGKVKLPYTMGSLDQIYEGEVNEWLIQNRLKDVSLLITEKLDGTSALLVYGGDGSLQIAYSRGNGVEGADITRHIRRNKMVPKNVGHPMVVRGEVIFTKSNFEAVRSKVKTRGGQEYKNARNMVAGLMNAEKNDPIVYDYIGFVAYDIVDMAMGKKEMLDYLAGKGFTIPVNKTVMGHEMTDASLTKTLNTWRNDPNQPYEIDGIVIDIDPLGVRQKLRPSRDTLNPAFAVKYKVADASNLAVAEVVDVLWSPSKHGYLKPRVNIKPVQLVGVTVQFATGFNAKFIHDNGIGPGAKIEITRSGDVIPFIKRVVERVATPAMPDLDWVWNETGVDAVLVDAGQNEEVMAEQVLDFFSQLEIDNLKKGTVAEVFGENSFDSSSEALVMMIKFDRKEWMNLIGANGAKVFDSLNTTLRDIPLYKLAGASPFFGRGVGVRKMKKLLTALDVYVPAEMGRLTLANILAVEGFDRKTATKILDGIKSFQTFCEDIERFVTFQGKVEKSSNNFAGQGFVFTGFRNKELEAAIEDQGGVVQSGVSKKTNYLIAANPNENSTKLKKARDIGVRIMGEDELREMLGL